MQESTFDNHSFKTPPRKGDVKSASINRTPILIPPSPFLEKLGWGTGVNVYKVNRSAPGSSLLGSPWAIKRLDRSKITDTILSKRLEIEADLLRRLTHPNIVGFREIQKQDDGRLCLAMEEGGKSLMDLIEDRRENGLGPFPAELILKFALDTARALLYLHEEHRLVHGDIKSQNILIKGNFEMAKLCDFGCCVPIGSNGVVSQDYCCSEPWTPPEVHAIEMSEEAPPVTAKADVFSFGLVLWEMIALCPPHMFTNESMDESASFDEEEFLNLIGTRPDLPNINLDESYEPVLSAFFCCTEQDPTKRPTSRQLVETLETIAKKENIMDS